MPEKILLTLRPTTALLDAINDIKIYGPAGINSNTAALEHAICLAITSPPESWAAVAKREKKRAASIQSNPASMPKTLSFQVDRRYFEALREAVLKEFELSRTTTAFLVKLAAEYAWEQLDLEAKSDTPQAPPDPEQVQALLLRLGALAREAEAIQSELKNLLGR